MLLEITWCEHDLIQAFVACTLNLQVNSRIFFPHLISFISINLNYYNYNFSYGPYFSTSTYLKFIILIFQKIAKLLLCIFTSSFIWYFETVDLNFTFIVLMWLKSNLSSASTKSIPLRKDMTMYSMSWIHCVATYIELSKQIKNQI